MKLLLPLAFVCFVFFSCNNATQTAGTNIDSVGKKVTYTYPFVPKYSVNWQPGDEKNAVLVLNSFKKYVDGDVKGAFESFADSVEFSADKFHFSGKKDSLLAMMIPMRAAAASMTIDVDTWETVYYPDQKDTWVTIWCKQKLTDKKGKTDSVVLVDDVLVKNDKIVLIDEKQRMSPEAKK
jgi:hypothetical protein